MSSTKQIIQGPVSKNNFRLNKKLFLNEIFTFLSLKFNVCFLKGPVLDSLYDGVIKNLENDLTGAEYVCITTDTWTSRNFVGFMGVTAHFVTNGYELVSRTIDMSQLQGSHTGKNISDSLLAVFDKWRIRDKGELNLNLMNIGLIMTKCV